MKTLLGTTVPKETRSVFYICNYDSHAETIKVVQEKLFTTPGEGLDTYANTKNPESQVAIGSTYKILQEELTKLHKLMNNSEWLHELKEYL